MKIKVLLLALGCTMGTLGAYAQKGVDNGTQFGSGEDRYVVLPISACSFLTRKPETSKTPLISGRSCTMSVLPLQKISICTV